MRHAPLALASLGLLLLGACGASPGGAGHRPVEPRITFPSAPPGSLSTGPVRGSAMVAESVFNSPARVAGRADLAADAVARFEFLAVAFNEPDWFGLSPLAAARLRSARPQLREAIGIRPDAAPQSVVDAFYTASQRLGRGDRFAAAAALPEGILTAPAETVLARLDALPFLPAVAEASARTASAIKAQDNNRAPWLFGAGHR